MTIEERLERLEKHAGITEAQWPPFGVPIEVSDDDSDEWFVVTSAGGCNKYTTDKIKVQISVWDHWRYYQLTREDWNHAPEWAKYRVVDSWGNIWWSTMSYRLGEKSPYDETPIVDVQERPHD